jgi:hypothetical protein
MRDEGEGRMERVPLTSLAATLPRDIDVFVCSASFEERCKSIAATLTKRRIPHAFVCENRNSFSAVAANGRYLRSLLGNAKSIMFDKLDPLYGADSFRGAVGPILAKGRKQVVVDITTFTHESLLIVLRILRDLSSSGHDITLVYNPASEYSIGAPAAEKWLCKGIREIRTVLGFPGMMVPSRPVHLIVLVGFEPERTTEIVDSYEPGYLSLGCGEGTLSQEHHVLNREFYAVVATRYKGYLEFTFPPEDPAATTAIVERQVAAIPGVNTVIAPMNTKLSTVGVAIAALRNDAIQVCYASARHYNVENYSRASDEAVVVRGCFSASFPRGPG